MSTFTQSELVARGVILNSQLIFGRYLDIDIISRLVDLFKSQKIADYIQKERPLNINNDTSITSITSIVYGEDVSNSTLLIDVLKNNKKFIHFAIHLSLKFLPPNGSGMIHIYKDIYENGLSNKQLKRIKERLYALISVTVPVYKPQSLEFTLVDGLTTPFMPSHKTYDPIIQREMKVIIVVLNNIFDETKPDLFIGKNTKYSDKIYTVHNNINKILENINAHSKYYTRQNKGVLLFPYVNNQKMIRSSTYNRRRSSKRPHLFSNRTNNQQRKSRKVISVSTMSNSLNHNGTIE